MKVRNALHSLKSHQEKPMLSLTALRQALAPHRTIFGLLAAGLILLAGCATYTAARLNLTSDQVAIVEACDRSFDSAGLREFHVDTRSHSPAITYPFSVFIDDQKGELAISGLSAGCVLRLGPFDGQIEVRRPLMYLTDDEASPYYPNRTINNLRNSALDSCFTGQNNEYTRIVGKILAEDLRKLSHNQSSHSMEALPCQRAIRTQILQLEISDEAGIHRMFVLSNNLYFWSVGQNS